MNKITPQQKARIREAICSCIETTEVVNQITKIVEEEKYTPKQGDYFNYKGNTSSYGFLCINHTRGTKARGHDANNTHIYCVDQHGNVEFFTEYSDLYQTSSFHG